MAVKAKDMITLTRVNDGAAGRTYFIQASTTVIKLSANNSMIPNMVKFDAYYRDGGSASRTPYSGRFVIEETTDGEKWTKIYTSTTDENSVTHCLYTMLTDASGAAITTASGEAIGMPRAISGVRCSLYAAGGINTLIDVQTVAVVVDVDNLSALQVLEILSGGWQGIYSANGKYYFSFEAARGGVLALGGQQYGNGEVRVHNEAGAEVGYWTKNGFKATNADIEGRVTAKTGNIAGFDIVGNSIEGKFMTIDAGIGSLNGGHIDFNGTADIPRIKTSLYGSGLLFNDNQSGISFGSLRGQRDGNIGMYTNLFLYYFSYNGNMSKVNVQLDGKTGNIVAGGDVSCKSVINTSDQRRKHDFSDIDKANEFIMKLKPCKFIYNQNESNRYHMGFKAQEVCEALMDTIGDTGLIVKEPVSDEIPVNFKDEETYTLGLRYSEFIAPHIAVTQMHHAEIRELQEKVEKLEKEVAELKTVIYGG